MKEEVKNLQKLPLLNKAGYATAELGITAFEILAQLYLLKFYTDTIGLSPSLVGNALLIAVLWDAFTDPVMGSISDRTKTRFGRRRPYILIGGILLGLSVPILFSPPINASQTFKFFYLLLAYMGVNTCMTVLAVPHISLGGELAFDRHERTRIFGWKLLFTNLGFLLGMLLPVIFLQAAGGTDNPDSQYTSRSETGLALGVVIMATSLISFLATRGRDKNQSHSTETNLQAIRSLGTVLSNPLFLWLLIAFIIATLGRTINGVVALYYYEYRLLLPESVVVVRILIPFVFVMMFSIPLWVWLSKKWGKKWPAFWGLFFLGILTIVAYPLFPPGNADLPLIVAIFGGVFASSILLFDSLVADVVDYDEMKTGEKREGPYFGFWKMATKVTRALSLGLNGWLLEIIGYQAGSSVQIPEIGFRLALIFGPLVGFFFLTAAGSFAFFPLTDEKHRRIQSILSWKRKKRQS